MKLLVGLGNPGKQYENTRHNAGFIILDELQKELNASPFAYNKKFNAQIAEVNVKGEKIVLAKPETFMNLSGQSVRALVDFHKLAISDLVVIQDDLDIDLGNFKVSTDSSAAGHNGIASIIENLGTQQFKRLRIGIEGSERKKDRQMSGSDFVLQKFSKEELESIKDLASDVLDQI